MPPRRFNHLLRENVLLTAHLILKNILKRIECCEILDPKTLTPYPS
jgi:hypothetical protein